jgi:hypothetical protein
MAGYPNDLSAIRALWHAEKFGDFRALDERLQKGIATQPEQKFAADMMMRRRKRPAHRTQTLKGYDRDSLISFFVRHLAKIYYDVKKTEAAIQYAMEQFHLSRSGVLKAMKRAKDERARLTRKRIRK